MPRFPTNFVRRVLLATSFALATASALTAQRLGKPVDRPRLREVSDTNLAHAYYDAGLQLFERDPEAAAAAFYWAARINPAWGEPLYARRSALLVADSRLLRLVMEGNKRALQSPEKRRLDSLQLRALMLNPFLYRQLDRRMFTTYIKNLNGSFRGEVDPQLEYAINTYLRSAGVGVRAWVAYSDGNFPTALKLYAAAMDGAKDKASIRLDRGRIFGMRGEVDSAVAEMKQAIAEFRTTDEKELVVFYESKALAEHSIGVLLEGAGDASGAREAYGRALQEDLSYYPAHLRLGLLALGLKDTTTALSELALAAQIATDEPHVRYVHGYVLGAAGHNDEAVAELKKAIELEPYYALPYLSLGQVYEAMRKAPEAIAAYQQFLDRSSAQDAQRQMAQERITEVKDYLASIPKP